jgi:nitrogen fixation/metabolism regulation signal transduction histidine kinase
MVQQFDRKITVGKMKLTTSLQLSAIFPLVFAIVITLSLKWWISSGNHSEILTTIFLALTGILGLVMTAVIICYTKDILNKIKILNEWTDKILKGDLEAVTHLGTSDDEISRLSYALSKMLREVKEAYSALHKEADEHKQQSLEHKRLAEAAQFGSKQLSDALNRLKESQQEIMQKERLHVYEQVIRGVVHDFGEAMTPIQGTMDILLSHPKKLEDKAEVIQHLQTISESVQKATKSIKNLAGIYHTPQERSFGPTHLNSLIERTLILLEPRLKANVKGQNIEVRTSFQSIPLVAGDESEIGRAHV